MASQNWRYAIRRRKKPTTQRRTPIKCWQTRYFLPELAMRPIVPKSPSISDRAILYRRSKETGSKLQMPGAFPSVTREPDWQAMAVDHLNVKVDHLKVKARRATFGAQVRAARGLLGW